MKRIFIITLLTISFITVSKADHYKRHNSIDIIHYTFKIALNDSTNEIHGQAEIEIKFKQSGVKKINLDLVGRSDSSSKLGMHVSSVKIENEEITFSQALEKLNIIMNSPSKKDQIIKFNVAYSGIPKDGLIISKNKFGERTFFGDNWPNRAHNWLPCIDHPYDKATVDFIITAPSKYQVVANGRLVEETDLLNSFRLTHWREVNPISTKIMVIGVAQFAVQNLEKLNCLPIESWVYTEDKDKGFYDFGVAPEIIKYFEGLIGPFPYEKLADVQSTTKYGGMENASNIFYDENEITGERSNERTVAHEIAHQWFGDAVSENDWDHIWLSEGFATFFARVFINKAFGKDSLFNFLIQDRQRIFKYYDSHPNSPIVDTSITDLNNLLNPNSYQKAAYVLRMLRHVLGEKNFWDGIKLYYKTYRNKNVLTGDFQKIMEKVSGKDLGYFFKEWFYNPGQLDIEGNWSYNTKSKKIIIKLKQIQQNGITYRIPIDFAIYTNKKTQPLAKTFDIDKKENTFTVSLKNEPKSVIMDPDMFILMQSKFNEKN